jgi:phage terminase large subunit GpA-like protein
VSPLANASWAKLAAEFLASKDDPALLKPFTCTVLAQGWRAEADEVNETELRVESFGLANIPEQVLLIAAGTDIQDDRIEVSFVGFARSGTMFVLGHSVLYGPTSSDAVWQDLDDALRHAQPKARLGLRGRHSSKAPGFARAVRSGSI